jgi:hypothetical protein
MKVITFLFVCLFVCISFNGKQACRIQISEMCLRRHMGGACSIDNALYSAFVNFLRSSKQAVGLLVYCFK